MAQQRLLTSLPKQLLHQHLHSTPISTACSPLSTFLRSPVARSHPSVRSCYSTNTSLFASRACSSSSSPLSQEVTGSPHHSLGQIRSFSLSTHLRKFRRFARSQSTLASSATGTSGSGQDSSSSSSTDGLPRLTTPSVSTHLFIISGLVFSIVVVGGLTRLTESGLSITEWNLVTGTLPPLNHDQWMEEYNKYIVSPEGTLLNKGMTLEEFKTIYSWEWGHRFLGRIIGLAFLLPIPYFAYKRKLSKKTGVYLAGIATLIVGQGALGWYMVKSGLTHEAIQARDGVPRVSQYRLAAHLGMAFLVYALALRHALSIRRDWNLAKLGKGIGGMANVTESLAYLRSPQARRLRFLVTGLTGLVFLTAISGAFVAGLDAGLMYNTFPHMGDDLIPPISELYSHKYSRKPDQSDLFIRNSLENPTTVQFDHRVLAITTFTAILGLFAYARRPAMAAHVPKTTLRWLKSTVHMAFLQVALGISTLVYLVPIPLAAAHQAGSLVLLSLCVGAGASLRMPGRAAQKWLAMAGRRPASTQAASLPFKPAASVRAPVAEPSTVNALPTTGTAATA